MNTQLSKLFILTLFMSGPLQAATLNVSTSAMSMSNIQVDYKLNETSSIAPIVGATQYGAGQETATGILLGVSYNKMFSQNIFEDGWSANWNGRYYSVKSSQGDGASGYSMGVLAQRNWFWQSGININAGIGIQYMNLDLKSIGLKLAGVLPDLGFNVGYAF